MTTRTVGLGVAITLGLMLGAQTALAQNPVGAAVRSTLPPKVEAPRATPRPAEIVRPGRPNIEDTGPKILINRFEISGNRALSTETLQEQLAAFAGQRMSLLGIYDVADSLTDFYRSQGFVVASVTVPAQKVSDGVVQLAVLEGRVGKVDVEGNKSYTYEFLRERTASLAPGTYLRGDELESSMLRLDDLPGVSAQAIVQPGAEFGDTDVIVKVDEDPYDILIGMDNHGRESIGRARLKGDVFLYNPTGTGDQLHLTALGSENRLLLYGAVNYSVPIGTDGTRLELDADRNVYEVQSSSAGGLVGLTGNGNFYQGGFRRPIIRTINENLSVGLWASRTESSDNNTFFVTDSSLNLIEVGLDYDKSHDAYGVTSAQFRFSSNGKSYDDNLNQFGLPENAQLAKFELSMSHIMPIADDWSVLGRFYGVASADPLMDLEKFRIGGPYSVRGFPSAELSGDQGIEATVQFQRAFSVDKGIPAIFKVFWDGGVVHRTEETRALLGQSARDSLTSVGAGISMSYGPGVSFDVEAAWPLNGREQSDGHDDGRIWAKINALF